MGVLCGLNLRYLFPRTHPVSGSLSPVMHWAESHFAEYLEADPNAETSSGVSELRERKCVFQDDFHYLLNLLSSS